MIATTAKVHPDAFVAETAYVLDNAEIGAGVEVLDRAVVCENAQLRGRVRVKDDAIIAGNAYVYGNHVGEPDYNPRYLVVSGNARIMGFAEVRGATVVTDDALVEGNARIIGRPRIGRGMYVGGDAQIAGTRSWIAAAGETRRMVDGKHDMGELNIRKSRRKSWA